MTLDTIGYMKLWTSVRLQNTLPVSLKSYFLQKYLIFRLLHVYIETYSPLNIRSTSGMLSVASNQKHDE